MGNGKSKLANEVFASAGMSETRYWELVEMANWPEGGYDEPKVKYLETLNATTGKEFRSITDKLWNVLDKFIDHRGTQRNPAEGGDDSHSDLLFHIIGLGYDVFYACLDDYKNIKGVADVGYKESFGYAIPYMDEWNSPAQEIANIKAQQVRRDMVADPNIIMIDEMLAKISETLLNGDGNMVADIYNRVCFPHCLPHVEYKGDDVWKFTEKS
jgi:hypothetical protein